MTKQKAAFIGTGIIGAGLAANALLRGYDVSLYYRRNLDALKQRMRDILGIFTENGVISRQEADERFSALHFTADMAKAVGGAAIVQESVAEDLSAKRAVYRSVQETCGKDTVIASSTSALFPSALSEGALYPERIVVGHPYNPSYLLPIVELCGGETASEETVQQAKAIYESWGKAPVVCRKEVKGFIVNRLSWDATAICREQVCAGVCTVEDMEKAVMYGPGMRMAALGQLLPMSLGVGEGGFRKISEKYGTPYNPQNEIIAAGIDDMMTRRTEAEGRTAADAEKYRDRVLIDILRAKDMI